jgi:hypothetical protein
MALKRYLFNYNFNYNKALKWTAESSGTPLYTQKNISAEQVQADIDKDIPRTKIFIKNKFSHDTSQFFYRGWNNIREAFCFIQGDMDGGSFVQFFWSIVGLKEDITLLDGSLNDNLRFGYVSDNHKRCTVVLLYNNEDPSKWMACITKDSEKNSFDQRKASLFISDYFAKKLQKTQQANKMLEHKAAQVISKKLGSELLEQEFMTLFNADGTVNISNITTFKMNELHSVGSKYVIDPLKKLFSLIPAPRIPNYFLSIFGGAAGSCAGWMVGSFVLGPLLAVPTFGLSLIFAPVLSMLIGAGIGMLAGHFLGRVFPRLSHKPIMSGQDVQVDSGPEDPSAGGGSNAYMAKRGLLGTPKMLLPPVSSEEVVIESDSSLSKVNTPKLFEVAKEMDVLSVRKSDSFTL